MKPLRKILTLFAIFCTTSIMICTILLFSGFAYNKETITTNNSQLETKQLPIIMYHNILNSRKGKYVVSEAQLDADYTAIKEAGFTPVFMSEVIAWVDGTGTLPKKPIVITFDDGHYNNLHYGLPIAQKHGFKYMINPVTGFSKFTVESGDHSNPNYSHITWTQMKEATESGLVEFGNHTHKMHKFKPRFGIMKMGGECEQTYQTTLTQDITESQGHFTNAGVTTPKTFAYPFGKYSSSSRQILLDLGFRALLTCDQWINTIRKDDPTSLHKLGRYNRDGNLTTAQILDKLNPKD